MNHIGSYSIQDFPTSRLATIDVGTASKMKNHITALIEVDVTEARKMITKKKAQKEIISFNAWLIKCVSHVVEEFKEIHAIRKGKKRMVLFEDVDVSIMIERDVNGAKVPLPYIIRKANSKNITDICNEIRSARIQCISDEGNYILGEKKNQLVMRVYYSLPKSIRKMIWAIIMRNPFITKKNMGTVMITSVGMIRKINGWVIPFSVHPIAFGVGSIVKKPGVKDNKIEIREYIYITVSVDHDVVDGAPAVRALSHLTKLLETGYGL